MSRIAAVTRMPSALSSGLSMISIGNSLPSLRRADKLDAGADLLGERVRRRAQVVGDQPLGEALRDDVRDLLAEELVAVVAELLLGLDVEQHDLAGLVDDDHRVRRRLEQAAVASLHLRQVLLGGVAGVVVSHLRRHVSHPRAPVRASSGHGGCRRRGGRCVARGVKHPCPFRRHHRHGTSGSDRHVRLHPEHLTCG